MYVNDNYAIKCARNSIHRRMIRFQLVFTFLLFHNAMNAQITNDCSTADKACYYFSNCAETSDPANGNIATISTTGVNTVQFQLQYVDASIEWIAIGFSETESMPNTYVFLCHRTNLGVTIQERFASIRSTPSISSEQLLTAVSSTNSGGIFNCTFTSPITRTPMLNDNNGYYLLLARGSYGTNIQNHGGSNRCVSNSKMQIATDPDPAIFSSVNSITMTSISMTTYVTSMIMSPTPTPTPTPSPIVPPIDMDITSNCNSASKACYYFSNCAKISDPANGNIATISTTEVNTVQFQLQFADASIGWIAVGFSETESMPNTYVFLCHRTNIGVTIQERFASVRSTPSISSEQLLTAVSSTNSGGILNCTFTSSITRTPLLNSTDGYWILLARGGYSSGNIQYHMADRCISSSRAVIATAVGSGFTNIPTVGVIYAMLAIVSLSSFFL